MPKHLTNKPILLKKSLEVFLKNGYYHTTFSDLAQACGIEKPHFYYYFKDKQTLMKEVLLYAHEKIDMLVLAQAYQQALAPKLRLNELLNNTLHLYTENEFGCLMGNTVLETTGNENEFEPILQNYFNNWVKALSNIYLCVYTEKEATEMAFQDIINLQGSIMFMRLYKDQAFLVKTIDNIKQRM